MNESDLGAITERLERLERQNRRLRLAGVVLLLVGAALATAGVAHPAPPPVLEAQRFLVRDPAGRPRAVLGVVGDASALNLYDRAGTGRASLTVDADGGSRLGFFDREGRSRVALDLAGDGTAMVGFYDRNGRAHAQLRVAPDGTIGLGFFDREGRPIWPGKLLLPY